MTLTIGQVYQGKVTGITKFGFFVTVEGGISGMVHISEIADGYVKEVTDYITDGQTVDVLYLGENDKGKKNFSVKKAAVEKPAPAVGFEDMLKKFKSVSEDKLSDIRRSTESKKGSYSKRR